MAPGRRWRWGLGPCGPVGLESDFEGLQRALPSHHPSLKRSCAFQHTPLPGEARSDFQDPESLETGSGNLLISRDLTTTPQISDTPRQKLLQVGIGAWAWVNPQCPTGLKYLVGVSRDRRVNTEPRGCHADTGQPFRFLWTVLSRSG